MLVMNVLYCLLRVYPLALGWTFPKTVEIHTLIYYKVQVHVKNKASEGTVEKPIHI